MGGNVTLLNRNRKAAGFTLIEVAAVLAIAAVMIFLSLAYVDRIQDERVARAEVEDYTFIMAQLRHKFGGQPAQFTLSREQAPDMLIRYGVVPKAMIRDGRIFTRWDSEIGIAADAGNVGFHYRIPTAAAAEFIGAIGAPGTTLEINGQTHVGGRVDLAELAQVFDATAGGHTDLSIYQRL